MLNKAEHNNMAEMKSVLVGLSGGADSVALTHILCVLSAKYGFKVYAAHVNHGLRGESAERDEAFSKAFAASLGIEFFSLKVDVRAVAKEKGLSEELAGREVRYAYFNSLCDGYGIEFIATAHHKNDNAETIIMNFMRGSGLKGLCGIPYRRDNIIRPLLDCTRAEIEEYCKTNGLEYVTDETNFAEEYTRNKIRHSLIPVIENKFNPSVVETVTRNAEIISLEEDFISGVADKAYEKAVSGNTLDIALTDNLHKAVVLRVIRKLTDTVCGNRDISQAGIIAVYELMKNNRTGTRSDIARGIEARIEYGRLIIGEKQEKGEDFLYELRLGETLYVPELDCSVLAETAEEYKKDGAEYFSVPDDFRICIRNRRRGDVFRPSGMTGTKKLKSFMIDNKIPQDKRDFVGILTINDEIGWIIGYRRSENFKFNGNGIKITVFKG